MLIPTTCFTQPSSPVKPKKKASFRINAAATAEASGIAAASLSEAAAKNAGSTARTSSPQVRASPTCHHRQQQQQQQQQQNPPNRLSASSPSNRPSSLEAIPEPGEPREPASSQANPAVSSPGSPTPPAHPEPTRRLSGPGVVLVDMHDLFANGFPPMTPLKRMYSVRASEANH